MAHRTRRMDNTEFVQALMEGSLGPLAQLVIVTAIDNYTKGVIKAAEKGPGFLGPAAAMINEQSWLKVCQGIQGAFTVRSDDQNTTYTVTERDEDEEQ